MDLFTYIHFIPNKDKSADDVPHDLKIRMLEPKDRELIRLAYILRKALELTPPPKHWLSWL